MAKSLKVAVVGAKTLVAESLLDVMAERKFLVSELIPLDAGGVGDSVAFGNRSLAVKDLAGFDFSSVDLVFICKSDDGDIVRAKNAGCLVVSLAHACSEPLVVGSLLEDGAVLQDRVQLIPGGLSCVVAQIVAQITGALSGSVHVLSLDLTAALPVSSFGRKGVDALASETAKLLNGRALESTVFAHQIAFNLLPRLPLNKDGVVAAELEFESELERLLTREDQSAPLVSASLVQVPVFYGTSGVIRLEFSDDVEISAIATLLDEVEGFEVLDDDDEDGFPSPVNDAVNSDLVWLTRLKQGRNQSVVHLNFVVDTNRKGVAVNALDVAAVLIKQYAG
jgi:aspartate-semialdehyde dehydrogenase